MDYDQDTGEGAFESQERNGKADAGLSLRDSQGTLGSENITKWVMYLGSLKSRNGNGRLCQGDRWTNKATKYICVCTHK